MAPAAIRPATASCGCQLSRVVEVTTRLYRDVDASLRAVSREPCVAASAWPRGRRRPPRAPGRVLARVDARLGLGADRVPDDKPEIHDRDLQDQHHEDQLPGGAGHLRIVRDVERPGFEQASSSPLRRSVGSSSDLARPRHPGPPLARRRDLARLDRLRCVLRRPGLEALVRVVLDPRVLRLRGEPADAEDVRQRRERAAGRRRHDEAAT